MLAFAAPLYAQNLAYAKRLVADLSPEQFTAQPLEGRTLNHAAFAIGHLAWVCDLGATLLGLPAAIADWRDTFSSTAKPLAGGSHYPDGSVLVQTYEAAHQRLATAASEAAPATLAELPPERFRNRFPTLGHVLLHMLTNHQAVHLGQLSAWRRALGLPPV